MRKKKQGAQVNSKTGLPQTHISHRQKTQPETQASFDDQILSWIV